MFVLSIPLCTKYLQTTKTVYYKTENTLSLEGAV